MCVYSSITVSSSHELAMVSVSSQSVSMSLSLSSLAPQLSSLVFSQCIEFLCVCFSVSCFNVIVSFPVCVLCLVLLPSSRQSDYGQPCSPGVSSVLWLSLVYLLSVFPSVRCRALPHPPAVEFLDVFLSTIKRLASSIKNTPEGIEGTKNDREYPFNNSSNYVRPGRHRGYTLQSTSLNPASRWMNDKKKNPKQFPTVNIFISAVRLGLFT